MAGSIVIANTKGYSGTVNSSGSTITFPSRSRRLIITNDSGIVSLTVDLKSGSGNTIELKPDETLNIDDYWTKAVDLTCAASGQTCPYRVWWFG